MRVLLGIALAMAVAVIVVSCGSGGGDKLDVSGENNTVNINDGNIGASIENGVNEEDTIEEACLSCLMNESDGVSDCTCLRRAGVTVAECKGKGVNGFADEENCS